MRQYILCAGMAESKQARERNSFPFDPFAGVPFRQAVRILSLFAFGSPLLRSALSAAYLRPDVSLRSFSETLRGLFTIARLICEEKQAMHSCILHFVVIVSGVALVIPSAFPFPLPAAGSSE